MAVKDLSKKTTNFTKPFFAVICTVLLCSGLSFYFYKEYRSEQIYAEKIKVVYKLMDQNAGKAEAVVSSYANGQGTIIRRGEGVVGGKTNSLEHLPNSEIVQLLKEESEKCRSLLYELSEPPEKMAKIYSVLLDAHISYKQYVQLALYPQEPSSSLKKREKSLKAELNSDLARVRNNIEKM